MSSLNQKSQKEQPTVVSDLSFPVRITAVHIAAGQPERVGNSARPRPSRSNYNHSAAASKGGSNIRYYDALRRCGGLIRVILRGAWLRLAPSRILAHRERSHFARTPRSSGARADVSTELTADDYELWMSVCDARWIRSARSKKIRPIWE